LTKKKKKKKKKKLPVAEVIALQNQIRKENQFCLEETKTRNVLIVGRTRSGKSTAIGVLKDPCHEPKEMSIFSDTVDPKFSSFSLDDKETSIKYTLNIIDTPGLKEVKKIGEDARSDEMILGTIKYCLKNEITKINSLLIFISFEIGVTKDDLDSFQSFLEKFGHDGIKIGICITRSEDKSDSWKKNVVEQLKQHSYFSQILEKPNIKICFIGCVDQVKGETVTNIKDLKSLFVKVYKMRRELLKLIFESDNQVKLVDLPISSGMLTAMKELFDEQFNILKELDNANDFNLATNKLKVTKFAENIQKMIQNEALLYDPDMQKLFQEMKARMKSLAPKMPEKLRSEFVGILVL